jgi:putative endonuclease
MGLEGDAMKTGEKGEKLAVEFLEKRGYKVLELNYRNSFGEIDIIALHKGTVVFIEVKTRRSADFGKPFEAVDQRKRDKMKNIALLFLKKFKREVPARFDVVSIQVDKDDYQIDLIQDAFEV